MTENGWKDIQRLETLGEDWNGFTESLKNNGPVWKAWYDLEAPEQAELPCGYSQKLTKF